MGARLRARAPDRSWRLALPQNTSTLHQCASVLCSLAYRLALRMTGSSALT
jgi:hypothetical protein